MWQWHHALAGTLSDVAMTPCISWDTQWCVHDCVFFHVWLAGKRLLRTAREPPSICHSLRTNRKYTDFFCSCSGWNAEIFLGSAFNFLAWHNRFPNYSTIFGFMYICSVTDVACAVGLSVHMQVVTPQFVFHCCTVYIQLCSLASGSEPIIGTEKESCAGRSSFRISSVEEEDYFIVYCGICIFFLSFFSFFYWKLWSGFPS